MRKGGSNWVDGDKFFDRKSDLEALEERVRESTHTLLTAQRRMGKTSLVRELQRRLAERNEFEVVFVDLEAAVNPADAVAEIAVQMKSVGTAWGKIKLDFANLLRSTGDQVEELSLGETKVKLRAGIDAGNWRHRGDAILSALAKCPRPVMLAIDELPILVNRMLKDETGHVTSEGRQEADAFLSWLRKMGQSHRDQVTMILLGSVSLEPLLEQAGLSALANIFSSYDLKLWNEETAVSCLEALAASYNVGLPLEVRRDMCWRLRCCIPHHVQMFFDKMHHNLRSNGLENASSEDVEMVYRQEMALGTAGYTIALEILTATASRGTLTDDTIKRYRNYLSTRGELDEDGVPSVDHVLQHDGYLEPVYGEYRFVSGLLENWWSGRYGHGFVSVLDQQRRDRGSGR